MQRSKCCWKILFRLLFKRMVVSIKMDKYVCSVCGYIYDPEKGDPTSGIAPGTAFEDLPDDWVCPECGADKDQFERME